MALSRAVVVVAGLVAFASLAGCSSGKGDDADAVTSSEAALSSSQYLGTIKSGETKTSSYANPPRYRAYGFYAQGGDDVTVDVSSNNGGDALAWITDTSYHSLAFDDDATPYTLDAKVTYHVPAGTAKKAYRIVFRDYDLLDASFTVSLSIASTATTCEYGGQTYDAGASFPASDGCNTCSCDTGGVTCTKMACPACDPENEPWRNYLGDATQCQTLRYSCSVGRHAFQNACGCGCELN